MKKHNVRTLLSEAIDLYNRYNFSEHNGATSNKIEHNLLNPTVIILIKKRTARIPGSVN